MTFRRVRFLVVALILSALFLASGVAQPVSKSVAPGHEATASAKAAPAANWTFEGCWTQFSAGPCRDIYRDAQGGYWICGGCGTTHNPGPGKCSQISSQTLATGFWCS